MSKHKLPKRGEQPIEILGPNGEIIKLKKCNTGNAWFLIDQHGRGRFGNAEHIQEDIAHFELCGVLPREKGGWY